MVGEGRSAWLSHLDPANPEQISLLSTRAGFCLQQQGPCWKGQRILQEEGNFLDLRTPDWVSSSILKKYSILFGIKVLSLGVVFDQ